MKNRARQKYHIIITEKKIVESNFAPFLFDLLFEIFFKFLEFSDAPLGTEFSR